MRGLRLLALPALLAFLLVGAAPASAQEDPAAAVFRLVNDVRASQGLAPFRWNAALAAAAQNQANWMAATGIYSHTQTNGSTPYSRAVAAGYPAAGYASENIVGGTRLSPRGGVLWWQNSPVHYNTMVSTFYVEAGVATATGQDQNFYVLVVGKPPAPGTAPTNRPRGVNESQPLFITPVQLASPREDGSLVHIVQPGQALWTLAASYDVDLEFLQLVNNLGEDDFIRPGDEILIQLAEGQMPPPTPTPPSTHVVQEGQTLWFIAWRYKVPIFDLLWLNGLPEDSLLVPGQVIRVRLEPGQTPPPTPTPQLEHIVQSGDSAWSISVQYNLALADLLALNGLGDSPLLRPGDRLLIRPPDPTATPPWPATFTPAPTNTPEIAAVAEAAPTVTQAPTSRPTPGPAPATSRAPIAPEREGSGWLIASILLVLGGFVLLIARQASPSR